MNKSVLMSIQPYWGFLIIARLMGWDIPQHKTVDVRKDFPKDNAWNNVVHIYCCKGKKSFKRIPKPYQPLMAKLLGKVIGEFVCNKVVVYSFMNITLYPDKKNSYFVSDKNLSKTCLSMEEMENYGHGQELYGWHISNLKIYDKPKELEEFHRICREYGSGHPPLTRVPQSWCYVEEL